MRSQREDEQWKGRSRNEYAELSVNKFDPATYQEKERARARRQRMQRLRYENGLTEEQAEEQIEAEDREAPMQLGKNGKSNETRNHQ